MATGAAIAAGAAALVQTGTGVAQSVKAKNAIEDIEFQELYNPIAGQSISTAGGLLEMEQANKNLATTADAASSAGSRGLSYVNQGTQQASNVAKGVGAGWDQQQKQLNLAEASADMDLQRMEEARTMAELEGYSSMYNAGQQNIAGGVSGLAGSAALYGYMNSGLGGGLGVNNTNTPSTNTPSINNAPGLADNYNYNSFNKLPFNQSPLFTG
jgi:hypothetical protein